MSAVHQDWKEREAVAAARLGRIDAAGAFFICEARGEAEAADVTYELNTHLSGAPMVRSGKTGKTFSLSWHDVLRLAIDAGIDCEEDGGAA